MKPINLQDRKDLREGILSPKAILENTLSQVEGLEQIVIIAKTTDGRFVNAHSTSNLQSVIGLLEIGKLNIYQQEAGEQEGI